MTNKYHILFRMQQFKEQVYKKNVAGINLYFCDKVWPKYEPRCREFNTFKDCFRKERQNIEKFTQIKSCINYYKSHNNFPMIGNCGENIKCRCTQIHTLLS